MDVIHQQAFSGGRIELVTCWESGCLLHGVTLSVGQYASLTESQLEDYRQMNRARWTAWQPVIEEAG